MRDFDRPRRDCGHPFDADRPHEEGLAELLNRCGHYYAHRIGGNRRGQNSVLTFLAGNPNVTQKELSEGLGVMPASLSEVLMKLERKGLIARVKDENDRRFVRVCLTEEGEQVVRLPEPSASEPFAALSAEEQDTLKAILEKLLADWELRYDANRSDCRKHGHGGRLCHGDEHPGHGDEHSGHGDEHPGRGARSL